MKYHDRAIIIAIWEAKPLLFAAHVPHEFRVDADVLDYDAAVKVSLHYT